jgi:hypothetical protein
MGHICVKMARVDLGQVPSSCVSEKRGNWGCFVCLIFSLVLLSLLSLSLIKSPCYLYIVEAQVKRVSEEYEPVGRR